MPGSENGGDVVLVLENGGDVVLVPEVVRAVLPGSESDVAAVHVPQVVRAICLGLKVEELLFLCLRLSKQFAWV